MFALKSIDANIFIYIKESYFGFSKSKDDSFCLSILSTTPTGNSRGFAFSGSKEKTALSWQHGLIFSVLIKLKGYLV